MITLDQIALLEQKIESAVVKIQQLQAENDALRNKCAELTNALSAKSEQLTSFETDQTQIEMGIKKALDRLNAIENSVLKAGSVINSVGQAAKPVITQVQPTPTPVTPIIDNPVVEQENMEEEIQQDVAPDFSEDFSSMQPSFDTMTTMNIDSTDMNPTDTEEDFISEEESFDSDQEEDNQDGLGFDIF